MHTHMYAIIYLHIYIYFIDVYICIDVYIYIYTYIYTHTYICIYSLRGCFLFVSALVLVFVARWVVHELPVQLLVFVVLCYC